MKRLFLLCVGMLAAGAAIAGEAPDVRGQWRTQRHGAIVDIVSCRDGSPCGTLAWVNPASARGMSTDARNPDRALRTRPLVGTPLLWGLSPQSDRWTGGRLYNPDTGQTFRCALHPVSPTQLEVTGCLGPLCRTEIWTRLNPDTP